MANTKSSAAKNAASTENTVVARKKTKVKLSDEVCVVSCFYGKLLYINKHTGYQVEWGKFGDAVHLTVKELEAMRNGQRAFFENQWVLLTGENADAVIEYLQLAKYYDTITRISDIDNLFRSKPEDLPGVLARFAPAAKETIARRAYELIQSKDLTDINLIRALEESLGFDLIS